MIRFRSPLIPVVLLSTEQSTPFREAFWQNVTADGFGTRRAVLSATACECAITHISMYHRPPF